MPTAEEQLSGGLIPPPRPRRPTPPIIGGRNPFVGSLAPPVEEEPSAPAVAPVASPPPAMSDDTSRVMGQVRSTAEAIRQNRMPDPAKGKRAVAGTIASVLGSLVNPQVGQLLSQRLLNPGMADWKRRQEELENTQTANMGELQRLEAQERINDMRANRMAQAQAGAADDRRQEARDARTYETGLRGQGAEDAPPDIMARFSRGLIDPNNPYGTMPQQVTRYMPGLSTEQQVSPDVGTVKTIRGGGYESKLVVPTAQEKQRRKVEERKAEKQADVAVAQANWPTVTEEIAKRFPQLGLKAGAKIDPERLDKLGLHEDKKPSVEDVMLDPDKYPKLAPKAQKLWDDLHRPPTGGDGSFQALVSDTGEVTGFFNPKTKELVAPPSGVTGSRKTPLPPTEMVRRANLQDTIENLARLEELAPKYKDKIGAIKGRLTDVELQTLGNENPEIAEMYRLSQDLTDQLARERSGAAISEREFGRLSRLVPNISQPYSTFFSNLKSYQKERARMASNSTGGKMTGAASQAAPGGTVRYASNGTTYNIPAAEEAAFLRDHPQAKKVN